VRGRLDEAAREGLDTGGIATEAIGQGVKARIDAEAQRRANRRAPLPEPLEWRPRGCHAGTGTGRRRPRSGEASVDA
jgi:hypothetical protein